MTSQSNSSETTISRYWLYTRIETPDQVVIRYERTYLIVAGMVASWLTVFAIMLIIRQPEYDLTLAGIGLGANFLFTVTEIVANWKATWETFDGYQRNAVKTTGYGFSPKNPYTVTISKTVSASANRAKPD